MGGLWGTYGSEGKGVQDLGAETCRIGTAWKIQTQMERDIKIDVQWINVGKARGNWRAVVYTVMNFRDP